MSRGAVKGCPRRESRTGQRPPPGQARAVSRSPRTPVLSLFPRGRAQRREWVPRSWADPSVHDKHLLKVFPVVSVINGPLTKSMDQVSRVNLQETLLRACPTAPVTQSAAGGEGELCGLLGWGAGLRGEFPPGARTGQRDGARTGLVQTRVSGTQRSRSQARSSRGPAAGRRGSPFQNGWAGPEPRGYRDAESGRPWGAWAIRIPPSAGAKSGPKPHPCPLASVGDQVKSS